MRFWLIKTEPGTYSWDDLVRDRRTCWEGVRNYQARNIMRDEMKLGDLVLVYHSVVQPQSIVGIARVCREAYPDRFAHDPGSPYFDAGSSPEEPRWVMVDLEAVRSMDPPVTREELKEHEVLADMMLLRRGSRLSVQPVSEAEWSAILGLRGLNGEEL